MIEAFSKYFKSSMTIYLWKIESKSYHLSYDHQRQYSEGVAKDETSPVYALSAKLFILLTKQSI